jgi:Kef-type K+ transport system membrane component KefB
MEGHIFDTFFLVFCGAAVLASFALFSRQPLFIAYIGAGILLGPFGFSVFSEINAIAEMSHIGIIFLLFLLGLDMQPKALFAVLKKATSIALISSAAFAAIGFLFALAFGFSKAEALIFAMASMFSSTIIGIKLLPTTVLHHKHTGEIMIGLLLVQDFLAIFCLLVLLGVDKNEVDFMPLAIAFAVLPALAGTAYFFVKYVLLTLIQKFDRFSEYIFLLAIGWCLGLAAIAEMCYLSAEIGAFIAGITLATSPISQYIALNLKPLRDFFLILFFFALGAQLNIGLLNEVFIVSLLFGLLLLAAKPLIFYGLLRKHSERKKLAWDVSFRLGQISEFSLLITLLASQQAFIGERASVVIQSAAILTFIVSSYIVIFNFPNPIAVRDSLRRD